MLKKIVNTSKDGGYLFVATADKKGCPQVAAAETISFVSENKVSINAWFSSHEVVNVNENQHISIVIWDAWKKGYQLFGEIEAMEVLSPLNGYVSKSKNQYWISQHEWQLLVRIDNIGEFKNAPDKNYVMKYERQRREISGQTT